MPENCPISLTRWNFVVPKAAYKTWSVSCQPFLKKRGTVKTLSTIDVDCSISVYCPHFTDGNAKQSYLPWGLFFINNQNNNTICSKSLIYNIKLPPQNDFSCLLWCKTCVARCSLFPAHEIYCRYGDWPILHDTSQTANSVLLHKYTNKPFLRKEPISWVYIFAGNYHFFDTWLGSTVTNRIHSGFFEPQTNQHSDIIS